MTEKAIPALTDARDQSEVPSFDDGQVGALVNACRDLVRSYDAMLGACFWDAYDELSNILPQVEKRL